jgi:hypothetical protein
MSNFYILSCSGKPIYSRQNSITDAETTAFFQTILSFFLDDQDSLISFTAGSFTWAFLIKGPLYYVAVSDACSDSMLRLQLDWLHSQMMSILTHYQISRLFQDRISVDLRPLLGSTAQLDLYIDSFSGHLDSLLDALSFIKCPPKLRKDLSQVLKQALTNSATHLKSCLFFGMLIAKNRLITFIRHKKHALVPSDLHLLLNLVYASDSTIQMAESWSPICLPKFNPNGFLYCYFSFLGPDLCLVLLSPDKDAFFQLSEYKSRIVDSLSVLPSVPQLLLCIQSFPFSLSKLLFY